MKSEIWIFVLNSIIYIKISEAQLNRGGLIPPPAPATAPRSIPPVPVPPAPVPRANPPHPASPPYDRTTPKCYPETARAYFLPAPPAQPKITILDPKDMPKELSRNNFKEKPVNFKEPPLIREPPSNFKQPSSNYKEAPSNFKEPLSNFKELHSNYKEQLLNFKGASKSRMGSNIVSNRPSIIPPPAYVPVLPELGESPTLVQDKFSCLAESNLKVCNTCASLIEKLPIFQFDQELLDGFLAGLGM